MKATLKILFLLCISTHLHAQLPSVAQYQEEQKIFWQNALSAIQPNNQSARMMGNSILYDKVTPFAALFTFNEEDNNISYNEHFRQALSEMHRSSDNTLFESAESLESKTKQYAGTNIVPVGILNTDFVYLNHTPENPNLNALTLQNNIFYPIDNKPAFSDKHISVIAPLTDLALGNNIIYHFDNSLWYRYGGKSIKSLVVDFGTGNFFTVIQNGSLVQNDFPIYYSTTNETKKLTFNIVYNDGSTLSTYAAIGISAPATSYSAKGTSALQHFTSTIPDSGSGALGEIEYRIFYGDSNPDNKLRKPFIIVDGFDPGDKRRIILDDCDTECQKVNKPFKPSEYQSIESLMKYNNKTSDLKEKLTSLNYDVIIVNFPTYENNLGQEIDGGADDIFRNGRTIASFIQKLNADLQANGSTEKLVVVGPSMGGQITRYALAYLEKNNIPTNTRLWISMDSPHQGATIPLAIQGDLYWMGEILGKEDAKTKYRGVLQSKAAKQMLLSIAGAGNNFYNYEHDSYIQELKSNGVSGSNGYPILNDIKKIAITNGSIAGVKNVNPSEKFYEVAAFAKVRFFGIKVDNKPVFRINNWFMPDNNQNGPLLRNYSYQPENHTNWNLTSYSWVGSLDAVPGGNFNSADDTKHAVYDELKKTNAFTFPLSTSWAVLPILWTGEHLKVEQRLPNNIATPILPQSFIPTHSALDTFGFSDWYQPIDKNLVCNGQTPFDSYYGESNNMGHITFTDNMVNWLLDWLKGNNPGPVAGGNNDDVIMGSSLICENQPTIYNLKSCAVTGTAQWTVTGAASIVSQSANSVTINGHNNGKAVISATLSTGQSFTKSIWVGKPQVYVTQNPTNITGRISLILESSASNATLQEQGVFTNNIVWYRPSQNITKNNDFTYNFVTPSGTLEYDVKTTISNACGRIEQTNTFYPDSADCGYNIATTGFSTYRIIDPCPEQNSPGSYIARNNDKPKMQNLTIIVYNTLGNAVLTTNNLDINLKSFMTGVYFVKVFRDGKLVHTQNLIKN